MRIVPLLPALIAASLSVQTLSGQDFDAPASAVGWSRVDADGSCTFYDPGARRLVTWLRDGTVQGQVDLSKLDGPPEAWVIDSYGSAWVVVGTSLVQVDKKGKLGIRVRLPAPVADLTWDPRGVVLSYRTPEPYLEKREYKGGSLLWSWGVRPSDATASSTLHRVAATNNNEVLITRGASMVVDVVDLQTGKALRRVGLAHKGAVAPDLDLGGRDRGPLAWWTGKSLAFAAVPGSQAVHARMSGLLLARIDLATQAVEFLPTGLTEDHLFLGIAENEALFVKPKGGLAFVPVN